jgi:hypothetical protein
VESSRDARGRERSMKPAGSTRAIRNVAASTVLATLLWAPMQASGQRAMGGEAVPKYNANP